MHFFGVTRDACLWLRPEEALCLMEDGVLVLFFGNIQLSVQEAFERLLGTRMACAQYAVYSFLHRANFISRPRCVAIDGEDQLCLLEVRAHFPIMQSVALILFPSQWVTRHCHCRRYITEEDSQSASPMSDHCDHYSLPSYSRLRRACHRFKVWRTSSRNVHPSNCGWRVLCSSKLRSSI